ncbi:hypothetical protein PLICRDRAFT_179510 [Plicaturopsis crispa FD-325 SS-3]|uniref:Cytochrome b561 domain-containing protein n=1 Tax=Plicaturopsis crispa FD-325 SS-3 TaxID=944288 RepID=A0A0C9SR23_PLICR|nr:hypothetical protein PLICRDRAFT_179510 [Plicaturopsis crispa FD-325 SS-3]
MSDSIPSVPLLPVEVLARRHALLSSIGFLILLPLGVLVTRYLRTFTARWWFGHWIIQFLISGPVIFAGWAYGHQTTMTLGTPNFMDIHQKIGVVLLILYLAQLVLGAVIHFFKTPSLFSGRRPPQNYLHAVLGLVILALAAYQVHYGLVTEWLLVAGGLHAIPQSAINAWMALIIVFWAMYAIGLALLPRQYRQERRAKIAGDSEIGLQSSKNGASHRV